MRLEINGDLQRSEVFRSQDDVLTAGEAWKAALLEKGWQADPNRVDHSDFFFVGVGGGGGGGGGGGHGFVIGGHPRFS